MRSLALALTLTLSLTLTSGLTLTSTRTLTVSLLFPHISLYHSVQITIPSMRDNNNDMVRVERSG